MSGLRYSHAVTVRVPSCYPEEEAARAEHSALVRLLRDLGLDVLELPPDQNLPCSVWVEDTAVVCNGIALMARPPNREKETEVVRSIVRKELGLNLVEMSDQSAKLSASDVVFTGKEFFVGLGEGTNDGGAKAVASAFPEYSVTPIQIDGQSRLKALVSVAGPGVLTVGGGVGSQNVLKQMERASSFSYSTLTLPEDNAANVMYINGTLVHRTSEEIPLSARLLSERIDYPRRAINLKTLHSGAPTPLSASCLLLRAQPHIRNL